MMRLIPVLAAAAVGTAIAASTVGCAWLFDSGEYEARPQTHGQTGLPEWEDNEEYIKDGSNR